LQVEDRHGARRVQLFEIGGYESAGVWIDSTGAPCLVIRARLRDDSHAMLLLYEKTKLCYDEKAVAEGQWMALD
jgi:hypothetical protein